MGRAIGLREDSDEPALRRLARQSKSTPQAQRLLALAQIYSGGSRSEAARIGGVTLQLVRDWGSASLPTVLMGCWIERHRSSLLSSMMRSDVPWLVRWSAGRPQRSMASCTGG